jgi:hypothetical protein
VHAREGQLGHSKYMLATGRRRCLHGGGEEFDVGKGGSGLLEIEFSEAVKALEGWKQGSAPCAVDARAPA